MSNILDNIPTIQPIKKDGISRPKKFLKIIYIDYCILLRNMQNPTLLMKGGAAWENKTCISV